MIDQKEMADYTCAFGRERSGDPRGGPGDPGGPGGPQNDPRSGTAILVKGVHLFHGVMRCVTLPLTKSLAETMGFDVSLLASTACTASAPTVASALSARLPPCPLPLPRAAGAPCAS